VQDEACRGGKDPPQPGLSRPTRRWLETEWLEVPTQ